MNRDIAIPPEHLYDAQTIWDYHQMGHVLRPCDVAIGLGSHDLGVATLAADLYKQGMFSIVIFSGANSPTTRGVFPRGEAVHFAERARELGVPSSAIRVEPAALHTGDNIRLARSILESEKCRPRTVLLISKPYMERRAYATCRKHWPEVEALCVSEDLELSEYIRQIGNATLVIDMLVGDLQRVELYGRQGYAVPQHIPDDVRTAFDRLVARGYTSRLVK